MTQNAESDILKTVLDERKKDFLNRWEGIIKVRKLRANRLVAMLLLLILCFGDLYVPRFEVFAEGEKTITGLGTGAISDPHEVTRPWNGPYGQAPWGGCYVYYGKYKTQPVKYRVLDKDSDEFGVTGGSLLLDCDSVLGTDEEWMRFDDSDTDWDSSDIRAWLNGNTFLNSTDVFTAAEKRAIAASIKTARSAKDALCEDSIFTPLYNDRVFLLDRAEVTRIDYGYQVYDEQEFVCSKLNERDLWWLRSSGTYTDYWSGSSHGPYTGVDLVSYGDPDCVSPNSRAGVCPAFNVKLSSVIFSSLVNGPLSEYYPDQIPNPDGYVPEYKLTLRDEGLSIGATVAVKDAYNKVTVPYSITDSSNDATPDRVSVVVTDGTWTGQGWSEGAKLLQYTKLDMASVTLNGQGTFTLDTSKATGTWGTDYHVYLLAEDVRGEKESDLASAPAEVKLTNKENYEVSFVLKGSSVSLPKQFVESGGKAAEPSAVSGIVFKGWYKEEGFTNEWNFASDTVNSDITLYGKWINANTYTVSFNLNGIGDTVIEPRNVEEGGKLTSPATPTADGHVFEGWYKEKACTNKWDFANDTVTSDTILYAKWTTDFYTVSFDLNGVSGTATAGQNVAYGGKVNEPAAPTAEGHTFEGWYKEKACTNKWDFDSDTVTSDTVLYAKWTKNVYTVSFDLNGVSGTATAGQNVVHGGKVKEPAAPAAEGYTFEGWYKEKACTNKWDFANDIVTADTVLYAKWIKNAGPDDPVDPDKPDITVSDNSISLDPVPEIIPGVTKEVYLVQGQTFDIGAGWYIDKTDADYKVSIKTVSISKKNIFKAKKAGNATITFDSGSAKHKLKIVVSKPTLKEKKIKLEMPDWATGQIQLSYDKDHLEAFYYSASPDVVRVDAKTGALTAVGKGSAKVSVYINGKAYTCTVTVKENTPAVSRTIHMALYDTKTIKVKGVKNWSSSAESIAKPIDKKGTKFKAEGAGKAVLTAEANGVKYSIDLYVEDLTVKGDKVSQGSKKNNYTIDLKKGESTKLVFAESLDQKILFKSSNANVAFVDSNGYVTARKKGKCKFTAKIDNKTITIKVNVTE